MLKKHLVDFSIIIFIFLIDRVSKLLIISSPETYEQYGISVTSFLNFNLIWNEGIAFGLFSFDEKLYYNFLTIFICLITVVIIWLMFRSGGFEKLSYIMIIGGSLGNIFDRIFYSAVPDFIDFHINNFHWFIFNVADIFITIGIIFLISFEIFGKKIIGVTCHNSINLAKKAIKCKANYIAFGAFYPSKTKKTKYKASTNIINKVKKLSKTPVVAIGGINSYNYKNLLK